MISTLSVLTCSVTLFVSLLLPPVFLVVYALKNRKQGIVSAWLLGAVGFVVPQLLIRAPMLQALSANAGFRSFAEQHIVIYGLGLAFTAGLFEMAGRFAVAMGLRKKLTYRRALAAGLGHGGIEAMVLIGLSYISNLALMLMIRSGADLSQAQTAVQTLVSTPAALFLLAGFERLLAMTGHVAMSMLVCYGVRTGKKLPCVLLCLGMHTLMDSTVCISMFIGRGLSQTVAYVIIYAILTAIGVVSLLLIRELHRRWPEKAHQEERS